MKLPFSPLKRQAMALYAALVAEARQPFLYRDFGIADTLDGRFDAIILYLFLAIRRLKREPSAKHLSLARLLQEAFISDMDRSLREMGVGDMGVGPRIKKMGGALAGRLRAYEAAMDDVALLREALERNVYRGAKDARAALLANFLINCGARLADQPVTAVVSGRAIAQIVSAGSSLSESSACVAT